MTELFTYFCPILFSFFTAATIHTELRWSGLNPSRGKRSTILCGLSSIHCRGIWATAFRRTTIPVWSWTTLSIMWSIGRKYWRWLTVNHFSLFHIIINFSRLGIYNIIIIIW
jgi:hypothetical protein